MATSKIPLVQGDTGPQLKLTINDQRTGLPVDLSDPQTRVRVLFREVGSDGVKAIMFCEPIPGRYDKEAEVVDYTPPYDVPGRGGMVVMQWTPDALDTAGEFEAEVESTLADGMIQTAYNIVKFTVREQFNG